MLRQFSFLPAKKTNMLRRTFVRCFELWIFIHYQEFTVFHLQMHIVRSMKPILFNSFSSNQFLQKNYLQAICSLASIKTKSSLAKYLAEMIDIDLIFSHFKHHFALTLVENVQYPLPHISLLPTKKHLCFDKYLSVVFKQWIFIRYWMLIEFINQCRLLKK